MIGSKLSSVTGHAWNSKSSLKIQTNTCRVSELPLCLRFMRNETVWACFLRANSLFLLHVSSWYLAYDQVMRFPFNSSNLPGENFSKYKDWNYWTLRLICFPKYFYNSAILVIAFLFLQSSWIQNAHFLIENCLLQASRIKFDTSTPSESAVDPKSLQSGTLLSFVRHMSGAAFGPGLRVLTCQILTAPPQLRLNWDGAVKISRVSAPKRNRFARQT